MPRDSGRSGPSDDQLLRVIKELRTPTNLKSLASRTLIDDSTLSRWLRNELRPIVKKDRTLFFLEGYHEGSVTPSVLVPKGGDPASEKKWLNFYLQLGWKYRKDTVTHYVLDRGKATSDPEQDIVPSDFRLYRDLSLTSAKMTEQPEQDCSSYFRSVCEKCPNQKCHAPTLRELCPRCSKIGSYALAKQIIEAKSGISPSEKFVLSYLSYEYRKEMLLLMEKKLRELNEKGDRSELYRVYAAFMARYDRLTTDLEESGVYTMTTESELVRSFPNIVTLPQHESEKAIRLTLNCARWHPGRAYGHEIAASLFPIYKESLSEYETDVVPLLNKALQQNLR